MVDPTTNIPQGLMRKLHLICIFTILPSLPLSIPYCAIEQKIFPALGLLPQGLSALLAIYRIKLFKKKDYDYQITLNNNSAEEKETVINKKVLIAIADISLSAWLFGSILGSFLERSYGDAKFLIAYAVLPMVANCVIHFYLFIVALPIAFRKAAPHLCSNCQGPIGGHKPALQTSQPQTPPTCEDSGSCVDIEGRPSIEGVA